MSFIFETKELKNPLKDFKVSEQGLRIITKNRTITALKLSLKILLLLAISGWLAWYLK